MPDPTPGEATENIRAVAEALRLQRLAEINRSPRSREVLEAEYGRVWNTAELVQEFAVGGFLAPFVAVRRQTDGVLGSLEFQHFPRFYFNFQRA